MLHQLIANTVSRVNFAIVVTSLRWLCFQYYRGGYLYWRKNMCSYCQLCTESLLHNEAEKFVTKLGKIYSKVNIDATRDNILNDLLTGIQTCRLLQLWIIKTTSKSHNKHWFNKQLTIFKNKPSTDIWLLAAYQLNYKSNTYNNMRFSFHLELCAINLLSNSNCTRESLSFSGFLLQIDVIRRKDV